MSSLFALLYRYIYMIKKEKLYYLFVSFFVYINYYTKNNVTKNKLNN